MGYLYLILNILLTVYSQIVLKWRLNHLGTTFPEKGMGKIFLFSLKLIFDPFIFSAIITTGLASVTWIATLSKFELSFAYPFSAASFVLIFILSYWLLHETITPGKILGLVLIVVGIITFARSSSYSSEF